MKNSTQYIIHIGTVRVTCLKVVERGTGKRQIAAFSTCEADGFDHGVVKNLSRSSETLRKVLRVVLEGEKETIIRARVGISHPYLKSFIFGSSLYFYNNPHALTMKDVKEVIAQTRSVATIPLNEMIVQAIPQEFLVNDLSGIYNPIGLEASRLGVTLRLFSMDYTVHGNLLRALERAEVEAEELVPTALATAHSVLTPEEKEEGVVLVDVGGHATWLNCFQHNVLMKFQSIEVGSEAITEALSRKLNVSLETARRLKETFVSAQPKLPFGEELVPIEGKDGQVSGHISRREVDAETQPVAGQMMRKIADAITEAGREEMNVTQVVFSGGGARLDGFLDGMQDQLPYPVRLGMPRNFENVPSALSDPSFADVIGMIDYTSLVLDRDSFQSPQANFLSTAVGSVRRFVSEYF